ncbi:secretin N-terminal domain-containing protein [Variovorax sp. YR752]|uniref:secretin N-terminal domain-containing protein n=1 Tax=Variovorax sp. YR752 TaxID=1884383 RepID=UPI003137F2BD
MALALLAGCAQQRIRDSAQAQLRAGDYEQALHELDQGLKAYPDSAVLRAGMAEARSDAMTRLVAEASRAQAEGRFDLAEKTLGRAQALQPGNARVETMRAELAAARRQREALAEAEALVARRQPAEALAVVAEALKVNPRQPDLLALQRRLEVEQRQAQLRAGQTGLAESRPISLDFRDTALRTVLDAVTRHSGINFVLDKDVRADTRVTINLKSAKVEDAIDLIVGTYQLSKKVVDSQTIIVYPNTQEKQREYQEQVVRVFHLASADAKGAAAFLRSMLKIREPYVDERMNMIAVRDSQENVQLAERLITLYDLSEPEVLLEVEVIEIRTSRLTELGVKLPDSFSLTVLPPAGDTDLTLANIRGLTRDRIGFAIGGATVNLKRETGDFNTLANPRIRVKNREKARVLVGDKVPVVSATTGQNGFVSDSVNYLDVGLKLDVEPTVSVDDEVSIRIGLEVSALGSAIKTNSGTLAYQIGTRNASTLLRLRDGETQLLAGLISSSERSDASRVPGIGDLPVMGRLFSNTRDDNSRTELVLSITPRILRNVRKLDPSEAELWVGTEMAPKLRPVGGLRAQPAEEAATRGEGAAAGDARAAERSPGGRPLPPAAPSWQWSGPGEVKVGETFDVAVLASTGVPLRGSPLQLSYPRDRLELLVIEEGDFFTQGGTATSFTKAIDPASGVVQIGVLRNTATGAVGQGRVVGLRFKALSAGRAVVTLVDASPVGLGGPIEKPRALPSLQLDVR